MELAALAPTGTGGRPLPRPERITLRLASHYLVDAFPRTSRRVSALGADLRPTGRGHQAHIL